MEGIKNDESGWTLHFEPHITQIYTLILVNLSVENIFSKFKCITVRHNISGPSNI